MELGGNMGPSENRKQPGVEGACWAGPGAQGLPIASGAEALDLSSITRQRRGRAGGGERKRKKKGGRGGAKEEEGATQTSVRPSECAG